MIVNRMKYFRKLSVLFAVIAFASCQSKDDLTQSAIVDGNNVLSMDGHTFSPTGSTFVLAFTADAPWTMEKPDWVSVNKTSGRAGTTTIKMTAGCNETRSSRTDTLIRFMAKDGSFNTTMKVVQDYPYLRIGKGDDSLSFNWNACRTDREGVDVDTTRRFVRIESNVGWRIKNPGAVKGAVDVSHFTIGAMSGENDCNLTVIPIKDNFSKEPYECSLELYPVVVNENGSETRLSSAAADSYTLKFHQKNLRFLINESAENGDVVLGELNDTTRILSVDAEISWEVESCPTWINLNVKEGKAGITQLEVLADGANPTLEQRGGVDKGDEGVIKLSTSADAYRLIYVSQRPYQFAFEAEDQNSGASRLNIGNDDPNEFKYYLTTTGTWEIRNIPDWLEVFPSECTHTSSQSGKIKHEITVKAKSQNLNFNPNSIVLNVSSTMNGLSKNLSVEQENFVFDVVSSQSLRDLPTMNTDTYPVSIVSSGAWRVDHIPDWITVSQPDAAEGTYEIFVGPTCGNPDLSSDREAVLRVVSSAHEAAGLSVEREILVKQRKYVFEVSPLEQVTLPAYKNRFETFSAKVKCSADWELNSCPGWISPSELSGDGSKDVTIVFTPSANIEKISRFYNIEITSPYNSECAVIPVYQEGFVFDNEEKSFDVTVMNDDAFRVDFDMTAEAQWELVSGYPDWIKPSKTSGEGSGYISFTPDPNPLTEVRNGVALVRSKVTNEDKRIVFNQEKYLFDSTSENFAYTELDEKEMQISVVSSGPWKISDVPSWVNLSAKKGAASADIKVSLDKNVSRTPRSATFTVVSELNNLEKKISVAQEEYLFDSTSLQYSYTTMEERSEMFDVVSSGPWVVTGIPSWMMLSKTSGEGSEDGAKESVTVTSTQNLTESDRSGVIKVVSKDNSEFVKEISVSQDKFDFRVSKSTFIYNEPLDVSPQTFNVVCPAAWTVKTSQEWLSATKGGSLEDGYVTLVPEQNLTTEDRSAIVTVTSTLNALQRQVVVSQPKFIFNVDMGSYHFEHPMEDDNQTITVNVNCTERWTASSDSDWIVLSDAEAVGNGSFGISVKSNLTLKDRSGKVTVTSVLNGLTHTIEITQGKYIWPTGKSIVDFEACDDQSEQQVAIVTSGNWSVNNSLDWVNATPASSRGNGMLTLTVQDNPSESERTGTIEVESVDIPGLIYTIEISQRGHYLELNKNAIGFATIPASGVTFEVNTIGPWTVSCSEDWCKVTPSRSYGKGIVTVTADPNPTFEYRFGVITVSCDLVPLSRTLEVDQQPYVFKVDQTSHHFGYPLEADNTVFTANVECSDKWTVVADSWIKVSPSQGTGNGTVKISPMSNLSTEPRSGSVVIKSVLTGISHSIAITQEKYNFDVTPVELSFSPCENLAQEFTVRSSGSWSITGLSDWMTVTPSSSNRGATVSVNVSANPNDEPRSAVFKVKSNDIPSLVKTVTVTQEAHGMSINASGSSFDAIPEGPVTLDVSTTGPWKADSNASWLKLSGTSGNGNGAVTVTADVNSTQVSRSGTITVSCANSSLKKTVTVTQAAYEFDENPERIDAPAQPGLIREFAVICSGEWTVSSDQKWISASQNVTGGNGTVTVSIEPNLTENPRTGTVKVISKDNSKLVKTISVEQEATIPEVPEIPEAPVEPELPDNPETPNE